MTDYAGLHPGYGFERHKGYGTAPPLAALSRLGRCRYTVVRASPSGERAGSNNSFNFGAICGRKGRRLHKGTGSFDENRSTTTLAVCRTFSPQRLWLAFPASGSIGNQEGGAE